MMVYTYDSFVHIVTLLPPCSFLSVLSCPNYLLVWVGSGSYEETEGRTARRSKPVRELNGFFFFRVCVRACTCWCGVKDYIYTLVFRKLRLLFFVSVTAQRRGLPRFDTNPSAVVLAQQVLSCPGRFSPQYTLGRTGECA